MAVLNDFGENISYDSDDMIAELKKTLQNSKTLIAGFGLKILMVLKS